MKIQQDPQISGGLDTYHLVSAATTNAVVIKPTTGQVFGWYIYNSNSVYRKVNFYNSGTVPIAGTTPIFFSLVIPAASGANVFSETGISFGTGIAISMTTGLADNDSAAVAVNDLIFNLWYK